MLKKIFAAVALVACQAWTAQAAHPLITDDTGTQGKGRYVFEVNGEISRDREVFDGVVTRERGAELAASISAGVHDTVDLVVGTPWVWSRLTEDGVLTGDENGTGDVSLEVKWRFFERKGFSLAVKPGLTLPTGNENKGLGNGKPSYGAALIATQQLEPFAIHVNAAYTRNEFKLDADKELNRHDIWHGSVAATWQALEELLLVANVGMESNGEHGSHTHPAFILAGAVYTVTENFDIDFGIKGGLNGPEPDMAYMAGIAYRF